MSSLEFVSVFHMGCWNKTQEVFLTMRRSGRSQSISWNFVQNLPQGPAPTHHSRDGNLESQSLDSFLDAHVAGFQPRICAKSFTTQDGGLVVCIQSGGIPLIHPLFGHFWATDAFPSDPWWMVAWFFSIIHNTISSCAARFYFRSNMPWVQIYVNVCTCIVTCWKKK